MITDLGGLVGCLNAKGDAVSEWLAAQLDEGTSVSLKQNPNLEETRRPLVDNLNSPC